MQTKERRRNVLQALERKKTIYLSELAEDLSVSTMTIRRDIRRLADQGIVTLIHGGAVLNEGAAFLPSVNVREQRMKQEKDHIASYCASLIREGNCVYLDTGSTPQAIAGAIAERQNIVVLTHSLSVVNILVHAHHLQLISMPGTYQEEAKGFFGEMTQRIVGEFQMDLAFFGACGVDTVHGMMAPTLYDKAMKQAVMAQSRKKVLAVDHTKIGIVAFAKVCALAEFDILVTDKRADKDFVDYARRHGVEVVQV